ncbi:hypothetical protein Scep_028070 [Stephania cephalantha]|uniref:Uncharacterized protein n=1 Tax=Stephania cephalantha TaxID=152367 RepID=A0AAP0EGK8_9MAGN
MKKPIVKDGVACHDLRKKNVLLPHKTSVVSFIRIWSDSEAHAVYREHVSDDIVMQHCSDYIAWKNFNYVNANLSAEISNIRLGLCIDGFQPFSQCKNQYSSWLVILAP